MFPTEPCLQHKGQFPIMERCEKVLLTGSMGIQLTRRCSATTWAVYMVIYPIRNFSGFRNGRIQPQAEPWIDIKISGLTLQARGDSNFSTYPVVKTNPINTTCSAYISKATRCESSKNILYQYIYIITLGVNFTLSGYGNHGKKRAV